LDLASGFGVASLIRLSLVLGAIWLAWPSIRRPAQWLPPGIALIVLVTIGVCALQPRLAFALIPLAGGLIAFAGFAKYFRGK
jgi:hypothetical protein